MRKRITALLALLCLLLAVLPAAAESGEADQSAAFRTVIDDEAGLLNEAEYGRVLAEMKPVAEHCHAGFFTTNEMSGDSALKKAEKWGKETFGKNDDFIVFIIDMAGKEIAVWSTDPVAETLSVPKGRLIVSNVYKMASNNQYAECAEEAFRQISTVMNGGKTVEFMHYIGNALMAAAAAILLAYLVISARMEQEVKVSLPEVVTATAGVGAVIAAKKLTRVVHHESSSGGRGFGGGGGHGGGGGFGGGGGRGASHGF